MIEEKFNRRLRIIEIIVGEKEPITSSQLSDRIGVSVRTIKNDMVLVKQLLEENGCELISKNNFGYIINIIDESKFYEFYAEIAFSTSDKRDKVSGQIMRFVHISRILISETGYITTQSICDELFISRTTLNDDLKLVYEYFSSYNIEVISKKSEGLKITGKETDVRLAMLDLIVVHFHHLKIPDQVKKYSTLFECGDAARKQSRGIFLDNLRKSNMYMIDDDSQRIAYYIILMFNRIKNNKKIHLINDHRKMIQNTDEYYLAKKTVDEIIDMFEVRDVPQEEIDFLAILLACWRDIHYDELVKENISLFKEGLQLASRLPEYFKNDIGFSIDDHANYNKNIACLITSLTIKNYYGISKNQQIVSLNKVHDVMESPVLVELSSRTLQMITLRFHLSYSEVDIIQLTRYYYILFDELQFEYKKKNIIVTSSFGRNIAQAIGDKLIHAFPKQIGTMVCCNLYEVRDININDYDCIVGDGDDYFLDYGIQPYRLEINSDYTSFMKFYFDVLAPGVKVGKYLQTEQFYKVKYINKKDVFETIEAVIKKCSDIDASIKIDSFNYKKYPNTVYIQKEELLCFFSKNSTKKLNGLIIYKCKDGVKSDRGKIKYIVHVHNDYKDICSLKVYEIILKNIDKIIREYEEQDKIIPIIENVVIENIVKSKII